MTDVISAVDQLYGDGRLSNVPRGESPLSEEAVHLHPVRLIQLTFVSWDKLVETASGGTGNDVIDASVADLGDVLEVVVVSTQVEVDVTTLEDGQEDVDHVRLSGPVFASAVAGEMTKDDLPLGCGCGQEIIQPIQLFRVVVAVLARSHRVDGDKENLFTSHLLRHGVPEMREVPTGGDFVVVSDLVPLVTSCKRSRSLQLHLKLKNRSYSIRRGSRECKISDVSECSV